MKNNSSSFEGCCRSLGNKTEPHQKKRKGSRWASPWSACSLLFVHLDAWTQWRSGYLVSREPVMSTFVTYVHALWWLSRLTGAISLHLPQDTPPASNFTPSINQCSAVNTLSAFPVEFFPLCKIKYSLGQRTETQSYIQAERPKHQPAICPSNSVQIVLPCSYKETSKRSKPAAHHSGHSLWISRSFAWNIISFKS